MVWFRLAIVVRFVARLMLSSPSLAPRTRLSGRVPIFDTSASRELIVMKLWQCPACQTIRDSPLAASFASLDMAFRTHGASSRGTGGACHRQRVSQDLVLDGFSRWHGFNFQAMLDARRSDSTCSPPAPRGPYRVHVPHTVYNLVLVSCARQAAQARPSSWSETGTFRSPPLSPSP